MSATRGSDPHAPDGALQAARHAAFLYAERCVSEVEILEVLEPLDGFMGVVGV